MVYLKRFLMAVCAALLLAGAALGVSPPLPYPDNAAGVQYYITGTAAPAADGMAVAGRTINLHRDGDPNYILASAVVAADNSYIINAFEKYILPIAVEPLRYQVSIPLSGGYGAAAVTINISGNGLDSVSTPLELTLGGGPPGIAAGTVPLTIARVAGTSNLQISWDNTNSDYLNPQIFVLIAPGAASDGTGIFTQTASSWVPLVTYAAAHAGEIDDPAGLADGAILHQNEFGAASIHKEVYYKALRNNVVMGDVPTTLPDAVAVGKVNIALTQDNFNLINIPLITSNAAGVAQNISVVLGDQLPNAQMQYNDGGLRQIVKTAGVWDFDPPINLATGFWLKSVGTDATITFVGRVLNTAFTKPLTMGWDMYGHPLPLQINQSTLGIALQNGDRLQRLQGGLLQYSYESGAWDAPFTINMTQGYWFSNSVAGRQLEVNP